MTTQPPTRSALGVLGFTPAEEHLYRVLLRRDEISLPALADLLSTRAEELRLTLGPLIAANLVEVHGDEVAAVAPERSLGRLISDETRRLQSITEQLEALRGLLPSLTAEHLTSRAPKGSQVTVEVVEGGDVLPLIQALSVSSVGDLLWLRPDQWALPEGSLVDAWVIDLLRSGRSSRAIYPARVLEEAPHVLEARAEAGELVRIVADVPGRLAVMGGSAALMPVDWGAGGDRRLVVRHSSIVVALRHLFEAMWDRAMAVPGLGGRWASGKGADGRALVLDQLARGAKDEQIARALGLSLRTVRRRVSGLMEELGAESRFQAGVEAVRRGWI